MRDKRVTVALPARSVGELTQDRSGLVRWRPDAAWERDGQEPRLGLDFLRRTGQRSEANGLPAWFENLLPERGSELRSRLSAFYALREGQSFELLRALGRDLIGAIEVRRGREIKDDESEEPESAVEVPSQGDDSSVRMSGLTGLQMKFSMSMVNERLVLPARRGQAEWIVKTAGREYPELAAVEDSTMTWARHAGFAVPEHMAIPFDRLDGIPVGWVDGEAPVFSVRRFDRRDDGGRIHQEDLCQALELRPANKYGDCEPRVSFEGALRLVTDACGEEDGYEMARRIGFMIASGNTDAHLKNWTLVWGDRPRPTLSPCYDLVSTISWSQLGWARRDGPELALRIGGRRHFRMLDERELVAFAAGSRPWATDAVLTGIRLARDAWPAVFRDAPLRMREALATHWEAVPLLRRLGPLAG